MNLPVGTRSRTHQGSLRRGHSRFVLLSSILVLALLGSAMWCQPDGIPPQPIDSFILSMHSLQSQHARKVRILHFGDSHIASDTESYVVRSYLQDLFGDAGLGLILPWLGPRLSTPNISYGSTYGWQRYHPTYNGPVDDMGLSLAYIQAASPNQSVWIEVAGGEFRVDYLAQPGGGNAEFLLDGSVVGRRSMNANFLQLGTAYFEAGNNGIPHRFEIRTTDSGLVRILGVSVEKSTPGIVYSALGLVGARAEYLLKCREATFEAQVAAQQPDLIILGYGTNESSGSYLDENSYDTALTAILARFRHAAPSALVILLTPPDRGDYRPAHSQQIQRILQQVIEADRTVAERDGAVVMDLHAAMGGAGAAERWASMQPPLARADMTHFTSEGYNLLGRYIVGGIMKLYDSGPGPGNSAPAGSLETKDRASELLPPLYPQIAPRAMIATRSHSGFSAEPTPSSTRIFYFLKHNGQITVTNDLTTVDYGEGRLISPEEAGCLLRAKATPCDNATRW